jgi:hypothetical protein
MGTVVRSVAGWAAVAIAAGGVAFALGALGLLPPGKAPDAAIVQVVGTSAPAVPAFDCPGGDQVAQFAPGARLYLTGRDQDGAWLMARSAAAGFESVWVQASQVSVDEFPYPVEGLDVVACDPVVVISDDGSGG